MRRAGQILPTATATADADRLIDAKLYLLDAYWWTCALMPSRWARKDPPLEFLSIAEVEVTVNTIVGATVTLSAVQGTSLAGRKFMLDSEGIPHRISTHAGGSAVLTLGVAYTGELTSGAARIFQDELTVASDILAWPSFRELRVGSDIEILPERQFNERFPSNTQGVIRTDKRYVTFISQSKIRLAPWTTTVRLFECAYNYRPDPLDFTGNAATDTPIVPREFRAVLPWRAEWQIAEDRRDKDRAK